MAYPPEAESLPDLYFDYFLYGINFSRDYFMVYNDYSRMEQRLRQILIDISKVSSPSIVNHVPQLEVDSLVRSQAIYLGYNVSVRHWSRREDRLIFRQAPELFWADLNSRHRRGRDQLDLLIIQGFWRFPHFSEKLAHLIQAAESHQRLLIINDVLETSTTNYSFIHTSYTEHIKEKPLAFQQWLQNVQTAPDREYPLEGLDSIREEASQRMGSTDLDSRLSGFAMEVLPYLTKAEDLVAIEVLIEQLRARIGQTVQYESLREFLQCASDTTRRWLHSLETSGFIFLLDPHWEKVSRALKADRKVYFSDFKNGGDSSLHFENIVMAHLYQAVLRWNQESEQTTHLKHVRTKDGAFFDGILTLQGTPQLVFDIENKERGPEKQRQKILKELGVPYLKVTNEPFVWSKNDLGQSISLSHFLFGL